MINEIQFTKNEIQRRLCSWTAGGKVGIILYGGVRVISVDFSKGRHGIGIDGRMDIYPFFSLQWHGQDKVHRLEAQEKIACPDYRPV